MLPLWQGFEREWPTRDETPTLSKSSKFSYVSWNLPYFDFVCSENIILLLINNALESTVTLEYQCSSVASTVEAEIPRTDPDPDPENERKSGSGTSSRGY